MAVSARRSRSTGDIWPGFVDALATMLIVMLFLLMVFVLAQFFLGQALSGRDAQVARLQRQVREISRQLDLERLTTTELRDSVSQLSNELHAATRELEGLEDLRQDRDRLAEQSAALASERDALQAMLDDTAEKAETSSTALDQLRSQLAEALDLADQRGDMVTRSAEEIALLRHDVEALEALKADLESQIAEMDTALADQSETLDAAQTQLAAERQISAEARAQVALLNRELRALRDELARLADALDAAEAESLEQEAEIADLGRRLNRALASKVEELARYRSEFFGRLREALGDREGLRIEGDRFVFQSEVLFESGSATFGADGLGELDTISDVVRQIAGEIPDDIDWALQVEGHTDNIPINTLRFPSNWELSAARAISVVRYLIDQGIPAERLIAAGFGPNQPIAEGDDPAALRRNRRIEFKLTQR